jgi:hypothetical protein
MGFHGTRRQQFNMTVLGIIALIVLVIAGLMVLRVKSDPMEKESVREFLSDGRAKQDAPAPPKNAS